MRSKQGTNDGPKTNEALLSASGLTKRFGGLTAVNDVDFRLPKGQIRCLIGPNGAGKSTFLKLLTGFHTPTDGTIYYKGEDITSSHPHIRAKSGISFKFQKLSTYQDLTVEQNLRIPTQLYTDGDQLDEHIDELLELVELTDKRSMPVTNLSHGEQQWLEIAMTMGVEPELLLLDEPTAGMTIDETEKTAGLVRDLIDEDVTVLIVEHDINFVRGISDMVTVMHNGQIFAEGSVEEIVTHEGVKKIYLGKSVEGD
ncbi:ABC transporter ATP-binding protein [Natrarchaeobius oligotrophus]|uniref:ABC transporter ATP-binding protein n=1 Tax=Natrarchaeobius chitinivorans TaxID=1679083 RepID=A0A3N6MRQ3_NATCH|nr:ABC transporter ATP-binding protein [Natrarchaeobius chitinivorans]RQG98951.1 ABC transporter ATP-binding protein [Natrarchaeobius chitinivorans]